ncbi:hypothetical protein FOCC_FOCC017828, partial [Frankliniella occidentalis]
MWVEEEEGWGSSSPGRDQTWVPDEVFVFQMGTLLVVVPPDILSNDSSETSGVAREGGSVMLRCTAVGEPEPTVSWRREDSANIVFRHDGGREKQ